VATGTSSEDVPLPKSWPGAVKSAILQVVSLAHLAIISCHHLLPSSLAIIYSHGWASNSPIARVRLEGKLERSRNEVSLPEEEIRFKDARMGQLDAHRRPRYRPTEQSATRALGHP